MDDALGLRALQPVGVDMRHYVVAYLLLPCGGCVIINVGDVRFHLGKLLIGDGQAKLLLRLGQSDPEPPPGGKFHIGGKEILHLLTCITRTKRTFIAVFHDLCPPNRFAAAAAFAFFLSEILYIEKPPKSSIFINSFD